MSLQPISITNNCREYSIWKFGNGLRGGVLLHRYNKRTKTKPETRNQINQTLNPKQTDPYLNPEI